ncbi:MAG: Type IV pilus assembly protein PilM [Berkelbacteria bacterium GW2011_GWA1_36_9]|uniref:Type IV pilus assembly protein PilM n=1 Tax=Berkelbacteria bacterium GW2011_GWA1_36_9 TaxID=1618331 RepID=A0A0G0IQL3_9BACT|nr:MAG: Type IV pilus assembly protein PilM [Berkelbacteria bacterium GW2011_GWA1_36_9]
MYESVLGLKKPIMGLDIGYKTLKVMQLRGDGPGAKVVGVAEIQIPPKILSKEGIKEKKALSEAIIAAIRSAQPHPITARIVSSALPESLVFTKSVDLPTMTTQEINKNIPYQAGEFFPIPPSETYMDWQVVGALPGTNTTDVLVVAAPKIIIDSFAEAIKMTGLELMSLETKPVADVRALISSNDGGPYLILDVGAKTSSLSCYDQGTVKLTSTISVGGDDLTNDFQPNLKNVATEVTHFVKYYQNRIGQATIFHKIILAGGGANTNGLRKTLEDATRIKTEITWPIIKTKTYNPKYATVIGLALKRI